MRRLLFRHSLWLTSILAGLAAPACTFAAVANLSQFHCQKVHAMMQCSFASSQRLALSRMTLRGPSRFVLDIKNASLITAAPKLSVSNELLKEIRVAKKRSSNLRIVFDLKYASKAKIHYVTGKTIKYTVSFQLAAQQHKRTTFVNHFKLALKHKPSVKKPPRNIIVVIDPGHGGKDPGATGANGTHEKDVVLKISQALYDDINHLPGYKAVLTRTGDYYLTLRERLAKARQYRPDLFIAIHADAYLNRDATGASVYALSLRGASSEAARWLAKRENESELMGGVDLGDKSNLLKSVLLNLSQTATLQSSIRMGRQLIDTLKTISPMHRTKVEQAAFVVLKSPDIPSLLIETGFISNYHEEHKLNSHYYQQKIAAAITRGIARYYQTWAPRGTLVALDKATPGLHSYRVKKGDTLLGLSIRYKTSLSHLVQTNHLKSEQLRIGQLLKIPVLN